MTAEGAAGFHQASGRFRHDIYSIDYTQDVSGVLDRKAFVAKLGFETTVALLRGLFSRVGKK